MSLYDRDNLQHQQHATKHRRAMQRYTEQQQAAAEPRRTLPSLEQVLLAAWQCQNPGLIERWCAGRIPKPNGSHIELALCALAWERQGVSVEDLEANVAEALAEYKAKYSQLLTNVHPDAAIAARTADLLEEL